MSKAKFTVKGIEELIRAVNNLDKSVKNKVSKLAVDKASDIMLDALKEDAPKAKENSKYSYAFLNKDVVKKADSHQAKLGINKDNWEQTRGLWFHYWGFKSHSRDQWVDRAFNRAVDDAEAAMAIELKKGLDDAW